MGRRKKMNKAGWLNSTRVSYKYEFIIYCCCVYFTSASKVLFIGLWPIMSHSLLWRHIVLLTVCVYSSNHRVLYTIGISMTRRCRKSVGPSVCLSICPSVRLSVCNANKKKTYSSFIVDSWKIIRISGERGWHPLQENEAIFSKKYFSKIVERNFEKIFTCIKCLLLLHYKP